MGRISSVIRIATIYETVQGEGCLAGVPMVLVRLQGCGVGCPFCDTKETWDHTAGDSHATESVRSTVERSRPISWVMVTGGEPSEQDLGPLVNSLSGYKLALETSGTARGHLGLRWDWICVSPKLNMPGGREVLPEVLRGADEVKMVVGKRSDIDSLDRLLADSGPLKNGAQICLQPMSESRSATALCVETVKSRNWRLSIQTHKLINLP